MATQFLPAMHTMAAPLCWRMLITASAARARSLRRGRGGALALAAAARGERVARREVKFEDARRYRAGRGDVGVANGGAAGF
mmetsp:Transcript_660/g.1992  ORF Transcript_660/g.1992 Transcript_660/m.1992 type:complete len:82 (-) Transcript_660:39-284(-)